MGSAAVFLAVAADFPAIFTTRELERWFQSLPASERAELSWALPGLKTALDEVLTKPLTREGIDAAALGYQQVIVGCRRLLRRIVRGDVPVIAILEALRAEVPTRFAFLGSEAIVSQIDLSLNVFTQFIRETLKTPLAEQDIESNEPLEEITASMLATAGVGSFMRANALLGALLELADRDKNVERARELSRLALIATVDTMQTLRMQHGINVTLSPEDPQNELTDRLLEARARAALHDLRAVDSWARSLLEPEPWWSTIPIIDPPPAIPTRLVRFSGAVSALALEGSPTVHLRNEQSIWVCTATPDLIERAFALRNAPVEALILQGPVPRLLRIDPPPGSAIADPATRAASMLRDWDELLHRLAR